MYLQNDHVLEVNGKEKNFICTQYARLHQMSNIHVTHYVKGCEKLVHTETTVFGSDESV